MSHWYLPFYLEYRWSIRNITVSNLIKNLDTIECCRRHPENALSRESFMHSIPMTINQFEITEHSVHSQVHSIFFPDNAKFLSRLVCAPNSLMACVHSAIRE